MIRKAGWLGIAMGLMAWPLAGWAAEEPTGGAPMKPSTEYVVKQAPATPSLKGQWDEKAWKDANVLALGYWHGKGSDHHPKVRAKLTYTDQGLYVFFRVADKYVRSARKDYQGSVCGDSCAEFFVQPKADKGYFNFEINCGGTMLLYYIEDPSTENGRFKKYLEVPYDLGRTVQIYHSMPAVVDPEIPKDTEWAIEYFIPFELFARYVGPLGKVSGQVWRANFYKCADQTSHPHWASWAPLPADFQGGFHRPDFFAPIRFE